MKLLVIDGHIIMASSPGVAIKFALQLVAILTNDNIIRNDYKKAVSNFINLFP